MENTYKKTKQEMEYLRVAVATPKIEVANTDINTEEVIRLIKVAKEKQVKILVLPELCITGYTCQDLFLHSVLIEQAYIAVNRVIKESVETDCLIAIGFPFEHNGKLYNVVGLIQSGYMKAIIPKIHLPNYQEFYEARHFTKGKEAVEMIEWKNSEDISVSYKIPFGTKVLLRNKETKAVIAAEICEDLWVPIPESSKHAMAGANIILNSSASNEIIGKGEYRKHLVSGQSARLIAAYLYASAGEGESTQDLVFSGHNLIAENGNILAEQKYETGKLLITDIDLERLNSERRKMNTYEVNDGGYYIIDYSYNQENSTDLIRHVNKSPFVPSENSERKDRCQEILVLQAIGLKKRMEHIQCKKVVIGVSGGLDSTLALLVINKTFEMLKLDKKGILAVTMPCFGTTDRTYLNACKLAKEIECTLMEIPIKDSVSQHLKDIMHDSDVHDITYENAQARERTQVLMDLANKENAIVIGTGDLSELALGWCTYNGDHMSMYAVNVDIPKTLVRYLVDYYAHYESHNELMNVLCDILDTPVSPELLPPDENGKIIQKTEEKVGPYELHDFYLYYTLRFGYGPKKILCLAEKAFEEKYSRDEILKWLDVFFRRFFSQQFKRSCLPDGPKIGSVSVSPRGDLRMPSDASVHLWKKEIDNLL
ncbi:NAD(+) synthase [Lacrimispora amygdalina]|uniref:NAD(+) synthase n=1 Tax=Lacrimispora amygdalina TaxID=253257 RepID=UPI001FA849A3|nr:NAD(+) synthase [Lacrimispora amygdalina]